MIYFIEGARNSGKSYVSEKVANSLGISRYQYEFSFWFGQLGLKDNSISSHLFAIGKETMLLQLIREDMIKNKCVIDRGIFSVLTWGVMERRITDTEAMKEMSALIERGLMSNVEFIYVYGDNPSGDRKNKDRWDKNESSRGTEALLMENLLKYAEHLDPTIIIHRIKNNFDPKSIDEIKKIIK